MVAAMSMQTVGQQDVRRRAARRRLGPHTREHQLIAGVDWRSREGKVLITARAELTAHVGGSPNSVQRVLIERAARLILYIEMMDARALAEGSMTSHDSRMYLAWVNALRLCLREIGIDQAAAGKPVSLDAIISRHKAASP
jgi:hypothetical protein